MPKIFKSRFFVALNLLVLFSATTHIGLLITHAVRSGEFELLNYFDILEIDYFIPSILHSPYSMLMATGCMIGLFVLFYFLQKKNS